MALPPQSTVTTRHMPPKSTGICERAASRLCGSKMHKDGKFLPLRSGLPIKDVEMDAAHLGCAHAEVAMVDQSLVQLGASAR
jgi:hypothetical protein